MVERDTVALFNSELALNGDEGEVEVENPFPGLDISCIVE